MAVKLSDDGVIATVLTDDGRTVQVASQAAAPFLGGLPMQQPAPPVGAVPDAPPPPELAAPLAATQEAAPPPDAAPTPAPAIPPPPPVPAPVPTPAPAPAPITAAPPVEEFAPDTLADFRRPDVVPTQAATSPTALATDLNQISQERADTAFRVGEAQADAADQIVSGSTALDTQLDEIERQRQAEAAERAAEEAKLGESYKGMVDRYAKWKVDPSRGISSDRMAWAWVAAAIAGLGSAMKGRGDQNPGLQALMAGLDRNVQLQMAERDALGNAIGLQKEAIADFRQATKTRQGEYDLRSAAELRKYASLVDRVKTRLGSVEDRAAADTLIQSLEAEATSRLGQATMQEAEARARARAARAAAVARATELARKEQVELAGKGLVRLANGAIVRDPNLADPKDTLEAGRVAATTQRTVQEIQDKERALTINGFDGQLLTRTDDAGNITPVKAKDEKAQQQVTDAQAAVSKVVRASQLLRTAIANKGGSSAILGTTEYQEAKSLLATIDLSNKDALGLGVLAGPDMEILAAVRGGVDPTSFIKDGSAGLKSMEDRAVEGFNDLLRSKTDYAQTKKGGGVQRPAEAAPAKASEEAPHQRVGAFTKGDPSVPKDDPAAVAKDAEYRLAALDVFLERDQPSLESMQAALRQVVADRTMPASTKAQITARLQDAIGRLDTAEARAIRGVAEATPGRQVRLVPEDTLFGLPKGGGKK